MSTGHAKTWHYAIPAALLGVLAALFFRGLQLQPGYEESPLVCQPAPEFSLPDLADPGGVLLLALLRRRDVVAVAEGEAAAAVA